jgi:hypothetical protein
MMSTYSPECLEGVFSEVLVGVRIRGGSDGSLSS